MTFRIGRAHRQEQTWRPDTHLRRGLSLERTCRLEPPGVAEIPARAR
jgi:hypothetical protein